MSDPELRLSLKAAPNEPAVGSPESQAELGEFSAALRAAGIKASERMLFRDAAGAGASHLSEFVIALAAIGTPLATILGAWLQARYGRKVRLKVGDVEAEARTVEEIEKLFRRAQEFREGQSTKNEES